jgi:hypothetical protein
MLPASGLVDGSNLIFPRSGKSSRNEQDVPTS